MSSKKSTEPRAIQSITIHEINYLLSAVLFWPDLFESARLKVLPEYLDRDGERHCGFFWRIVLGIAERHGGRLPMEGTLELVRLEVLKAAEHELKVQHPQLYSDLLAHGGILHLATGHYNRQNLNRTTAFKVLHALLYERRIVKRLSTIAAQSHSIDIREQLEDLHRDASRLSGMGASDVVAVHHTRSNRPGLQLFPTGLQYFDSRLNGGVSPGKVYGLLGPTGVGKTLNLVSLMVSSAMQEQVRYAREVAEKGAENAKLGSYYYFCYEGEAEDIIRRCMAFMAHIPLDRLARYETDPTMEFAGPNDPIPEYQQKYFPDGVGPYGEVLLSEMERYCAANAALSKNVFVRSMIPTPEDPTRGCGGFAEIQNVLLAEHEIGRTVMGYYVDYAKLVAKNHCGNKLDHLRHSVSSLPMQCAGLNAVLKTSHCWIANQFNTEANRRAPTWVPHHSYSAEAGDFGDNCWFAFCLGTKVIEDNCCLLHCSKQRDFQVMPPSTMHIHGGFNRMVCMDEDIELDLASNYFHHKTQFDRDPKGALIVPFRRRRVGA